MAIWPMWIWSIPIVLVPLKQYDLYCSFHIWPSIYPSTRFWRTPEQLHIRPYLEKKILLFEYEDGEYSLTTVMSLQTCNDLRIWSQLLRTSKGLSSLYYSFVSQIDCFFFLNCCVLCWFEMASLSSINRTYNCLCDDA